MLRFRFRPVCGFRQYTVVPCEHGQDGNGLIRREQLAELLGFLGGSRTCLNYFHAGGSGTTRGSPAKEALQLRTPGA
jgi:hypothetical protein